MTSNKFIFFFLLFSFHIAISAIVTLISHSDFLSSLHNGKGYWYVTRDAILYHREALIQLDYLMASQWESWLKSFAVHHNVKLISLTYWVTGFSSPFAFSIVNSIVWVSSVTLIFKSSKVLFSDKRYLLFLSLIFFLQPSILFNSTQLLRDPIFILGICCFIYGWSILDKEHAKWRWLVFIVLGFILTASMRSYLFPVFAITTICFMVWIVFKKRDMFFPFVVLLFLLAAYNLSYVNSRYQGIDVMANVEKNSENVVFDLRSAGLDNEQIKQQLQKQFELQMNQLVYKAKFDNASTTQRINEKKDVAIKALLERLELSVDELEEKIQALEKQAKFEIEELVLITESKIRELEEEYKKKLAELDLLIIIDTANLQELTKPEPSFYWSYLDRVSRHLGSLRRDFMIALGGVDGSRIDENLVINKLPDLMFYLPRAVQISFTAPFPNDWLSEGKEVGKIGKMLAGAEMILWYLVLIGFVYLSLHNIYLFKPLIVVFIFSITIIVLLGVVVPNVGALYRMRQGYMIPFFIFGLYGLKMIIYRYVYKSKLKI
jgi:hypothetical protein